MTAHEVRRLWWAAMDIFWQAEQHQLPPAETQRAWMHVFYLAKRLLRLTRRSHGRLPKPPGLEELQQEAASHLQKRYF